MLVGINLIKFLMTTSPSLNTTRQGCKYCKAQSIDYKHTITVRKQRKKFPRSKCLTFLFITCKVSWCNVNIKLWTPVGLQNVARGGVIDNVIMNSDGPWSQTLPEAVVVKFSHLEPYMPAFIEYYPRRVAIPTITDKWKKPSGNEVFTRTQFHLNLSWAFTIQKSQGKTLERLVIYLGAGEKCNGLTLVALLRVRMFKHFLLKPSTLEWLRRVNTSSGLVDIKCHTPYVLVVMKGLIILWVNVILLYVSKRTPRHDGWLWRV